MEKLVEILLAEDDTGDIRLIEESLKSSKLHVHLNIVNDGQRAIDFLNKVGEYKSAKTPDLVLLDLNMPVKDGREVLQEMKESSSLKTIPVVILTTSDSEKDIAETYSAGANCYVTKPVDFEQFQKIVNEITDFWFSIVKLPPHEG